MTLFDFEDLKKERVHVAHYEANVIKSGYPLGGTVTKDIYIENFWAGAYQNISNGIVGEPSGASWLPELFVCIPLSKFENTEENRVKITTVYNHNGETKEETSTLAMISWYISQGYRNLFPSASSNEFVRGGMLYVPIQIVGRATDGACYIEFNVYDGEYWELYSIPSTQENVGLYDNEYGINIQIYGDSRIVAEDKFFYNIGVPYAEGLVVNNEPYYPEINAQGDGWETQTGWRMQTGVNDLSQPSLNWFNLLRAITGENGGLNFPYQPSDIFMNWVVYLDGEKKPIISINGGSSAIQFDGVIEPTESYVELCVGKGFEFTPTVEMIDNPNFVEKITNNYPVLKMPLNTSYVSILEYADPSLLSDVVSNLFNFIPNGNKICLLMRVATYAGEVVEHYSDWCYVQVPAKLPSNPDEVVRGKITANDTSTITVVYGYAKESDDFYPDDMGSGSDSDEPSDTIDGAEGYTAHSLLTTTYAMTPTRLQQIGRVLWSDGFMDNIQLVNNSPIENIVSVKMFPFSISGTDENIMLGNVSTGVNGAKVSNDYSYKKTIGSMSITKKYNSFLDYAPFTKLSIFLPFIGYKELDTDVYMGRTLKVEYITDLVTGACKAILYADNIPTDDFDGSMGIDIPITGSNRAQVESGYIMSAVGGGMQLASGNIGGAIGTVLNGAMSKYSSTTKGNASPSCGAYQTRNIFVVYNRPSWQDLGAFNHTHGRMCNQSKLLNGLHGFTKVADGVDLSTIPCTEEERTMIKEYLTRGIYL